MSLPKRRKPINIKVTSVGDADVGKKTMRHVYSYKDVPPLYVPAAYDIFVESLTIEGVQYKLQLCDIRGQENYDRLRPLTYINTTCFLVCFSIQSRDSYDNVLSKWTPELRRLMPNTPIILVGLKCDLRKEEDPDKPTLKPEDGEEMREKIQAVEYLECSAMHNEGIEEIILAAVKHSKSSKPKRPKRQCTIS